MKKVTKMLKPVSPRKFSRKFDTPRNEGTTSHAAGAALTPSEGQKPKLSEVLKSAIAKVFGTQRVAAERLGFDYDALRKALQHNKYVLQDLDALVSAMDLPQKSVDELKRSYRFEIQADTRGYRRALVDLDAKTARGTATLDDTFEVIESQTRRLLGQFQGLEEDVGRAFDAMGERDVMILILTDEFPVEWHGSKAGFLRQKVIRCLKNKGSICYGYPSQNIVNAIQDQRASDQAKPPELFESLFNDFKSQLRQADLNETLLNDHLCAVQHSAPIFFTGHKFCLYHSSHGDGNSRNWGVVACPVGLGEEAGYVDDRVMVLMSKDCKERLFNFCVKMIRTGIEIGARESNPQVAALRRIETLLSGRKAT